MDFGLPVVATIVVISYLAGDFVKKSKVNNKNYKQSIKVDKVIILCLFYL